MKIAFDAKRFFHNSSGLGNYSRDLVRILATYNPSAEILLLDKKGSEKGKEICKLPNVKFLPTTKGFLARQTQMGKDAQKEKVDNFHGLSGELPLFWDAIPCKKIVTIHDLIFMRFPKYYSFLDAKIHYWKFKKAAKSADKIIAISEQTKRDIIHFLKVPESKIEVVYQGCHQAFKQIHSSEQCKYLKEKFGLPNRFVLNVGTIEERKNLLQVIRALANTDIPLVVVGKKTSYFKTIQQFISKNPIKNKVFFLENVTMDELAVLYSMADIFVYPSLFEGFGIPVIEALFSKTVVVTSNRSCLPEAGGPDSVYIDPENSHDILAKIQHLWDNPEERKRREEKGLLFVQKFNDEVIASQLINLYNKILL